MSNVRGSFRKKNGRSKKEKKENVPSLNPLSCWASSQNDVQWVQIAAARELAFGGTNTTTHHITRRRCGEAMEVEEGTEADQCLGRRRE
jgi:hypothetical protein